RLALERMWTSMVERQMYIHGGLGSRHENEGFGGDYELPNARAYAETCAAVANGMWNWRMLQIEADSRYADLLELALYNNVLAGVSLDGEGYFYQNPLSDDGSHRRQRWFTVACCPGNLARMLASLPGMIYSASVEGVWVHLYAASHASIALPDSRNIRLAQRTDYPWSGEVAFTMETPGRYSLFLRLPGWCGQDWSADANGEPVPARIDKGYLRIERDWQAGDRVSLKMPMKARQVECAPQVVENQGRVALMYGPLLYCFEGADHPGLDVRRLLLAPQDFTARFHPDLLGGVVALHGQAVLRENEADWDTRLYRPRLETSQAQRRTVPATAIPYYAWANRAPGEMQVWVRVE
ncbi:MAG: glycoside hydrolase family 127 protein, partial [Omnitrophica WOR_2 bacterium]